MFHLDLSRGIGPATPVYPGDPGVRFVTHADYCEGGYRVSRISLGTHAGTHLDAPAHVLPEGTAVDGLSLAALLGPARVVRPDADPRVKPGDRVLIRCGWGSRWGASDYFTGFPPVPEAWARALAAAPAALVGVETPSLHPDAEMDYRLHRLLLEAGVVIVENLANLDRAPDEFFLAALPIPLEGLDGAPCRVVALIGGGSACG
jgi:arylformamidase